MRELFSIISPMEKANLFKLISPLMKDSLLKDSFRAMAHTNRSHISKILSIKLSRIF